MTRSARGDGRDKVRRGFRSGDMRGIASIVMAIVTTLTPFKTYHRMIHRRIGKGAARTLMATVTVDFRR